MVRQISKSFDVAALFPSVPVAEALQSLRRHLERSRAPLNHIEAYISVAQVCMNQNFFTFRGKFYRQTFGLSMGSKLSPLLADVFMSDFENKAQKHKLFPRVWWRYVDDVFAPVKERYLDQTLTMLNSQHETIKFTVEKEQDGKLPFLDLMISRKDDNTLSFGIFRKPTSTDRYITSDSSHSGAQKQAAFHSMAHRLYNVPMDNEEFEEERARIYNAAEVNGYERKFVDKIFQKHKLRKQRQHVTTLEPIKEETRRVSLPFYPKVTNPIKTSLQRQGIQVVHKSDNTLRDLLCNLKDKVPPDDQSGIYQIPCQDCSAVYIGQTRRKIKIRLREHRNAVVSNRTNESSVAVHASNCNHSINWQGAKLIKAVRKVSHLNAWESMFINKSEEPLMNEDDPPITSCLFNIADITIH